MVVHEVTDLAPVGPHRVVEGLDGMREDGLEVLGAEVARDVLLEEVGAAVPGGLAIAPLLIIWFGFGLLPKVIIVVLICFFPLAVSTADGLASADPDLLALLRAMGAQRSQIWRIVRFPAALPSFFSGLRVAVTYSVVGATIGEWVGGSAGLGLYMLRSKNALATDQVFVAILVTSVISIGLFLLIFLFERLALPWYHSAQRRQHWDEEGIY